MRTIRPAGVRLWEEAIDPTELDHVNDAPIDRSVPSPNALLLRYLIEHQLKGEQRRIVDAYLAGKTYKSIEVTEKTWRYNLRKAIKILKQQFLDTKHQTRLKSDFNRRIYETHSSTSI